MALSNLFSFWACVRGIVPPTCSEGKQTTIVAKMSDVIFVLLEISTVRFSTDDLLFVGLEHGGFLVQQHLIQLRSEADRTGCNSKIFGCRSDNTF